MSILDDEIRFRVGEQTRGHVLTVRKDHDRIDSLLLELEDLRVDHLRIAGDPEGLLDQQRRDPGRFNPAALRALELPVRFERLERFFPARIVEAEVRHHDGRFDVATPAQVLDRCVAQHAPQVDGAVRPPVTRHLFVLREESRFLELHVRPPRVERNQDQLRIRRGQAPKEIPERRRFFRRHVQDEEQIARLRAGLGCPIRTEQIRGPPERHRHAEFARGGIEQGLCAIPDAHEPDPRRGRARRPLDAEAHHREQCHDDTDESRRGLQKRTLVPNTTPKAGA